MQYHDYPLVDKSRVFLQIDLGQPLAPQGPFDVIVHKLSDVIVESEHDQQSKHLLANFQV